MPKYIEIDGVKVRVWTDEEYVQANCRALNNAGIGGYHEKAFTLDDLKAAHVEGLNEGSKMNSSLYGEAIKSGHIAGFAEGAKYGKEVERKHSISEFKKQLEIEKEASYAEGHKHASTEFKKQFDALKDQAYKQGIKQGSQEGINRYLDSLKFSQFVTYKTKIAMQSNLFRPKFYVPKTTFPKSILLMGGVAVGVGAFAAGLFARKSLPAFNKNLPSSNQVLKP